VRSPSDVALLDKALADKYGLVRFRAADSIDKLKGAKPGTPS
jgi:hypothetical protein